MNIRSTSVLLISIALSACGGGGGGGSSSTPTPTPTQQSSAGFWAGTTSTGRTVFIATLDNGEYWAIYSSQGNSAVTAGFVEGASATSGSSITSSNMRDFNFEGLGTLSGTISGSFVQDKTIALTATYPSLSQTVTTTGNFSSDYNTTPSLATIAGNYSGQIGFNGGTQYATGAISVSGVISTSIGGCQSTGQIQPHAAGNIYDVVLTTGPSPCAGPNVQLSGIAYYDSATHYIYVAIIDSGRNNGMIFIGAKQ